MKLLHLPSILALAAAALVAAPVSSQAKGRTVTVLRDRDGDGHFNKKKIEVRDYHSGGGRSYGGYARSRYYGNSYYGRPSYGSSYYGSPYGYGYRSYGPSVGVSYYSSPSYSYGYADDTAVDVQRELRRRGYYRGAIDGDVGPGTRSAIRAYQHDRGLGASGRIDGALLRALGV